MEMLIGF